jgi:hypothetical protein
LADYYVGAWNNFGTESNWSGTYLSTDAIASNRWHHVALTLDAKEGMATLQSGVLAAYLDGVRFGTGAGAQIWSHGDDIGIGAINQGTQFHNGDMRGTGSNAFQGSIDSVRVYNRALAAAEISQLANRTPVASDDRAETQQDTSVTIAVADLLGNDSDPDGDLLSVVTVGNGINGSATLDSNGNVVFTPTTGFVGDASFVYAIDDGRGGQDTATVIVSVAAKPFAIGTNLAAVTYYSTQQPFIDGFKYSQRWITQNPQTWDTGESQLLDLDENGWVKSLPAPEAAPQYETVGSLLYREQQPYFYPGGKYVVLYEGQGTIEYGFDGKKDVAASRPGRDVIDVTPSDAGIWLKITATDPNGTGDYLRNIRVVPTAYEKTYQTEIFNPDFVEKIQPYTALRFMDWVETNNSEEKEWSDRPTLATSTFTEKGVPVELMVELANQTDADPWFSMPHQATDEYVTNFASYVKEHRERIIGVMAGQAAYRPTIERPLASGQTHLNFVNLY